MTRGVALIGAGPVAQAIHLPTIGRFRGRLRVTDVVDVDTQLASRVAHATGARPWGSLDDLLTDHVPDVAVVGSPDRFHAAQIVLLCAAGVRGILAEKPLAIGEAELDGVRRAVDDSRTALVVGAMHTYDPAWLAARDAFDDPGPFHARLVTYLPANARFEDMATLMDRPSASPPRPADDAERLRGGILGLAIHDLPLIRRYVPHIDHVTYVRALEPWGYVVEACGARGSVELVARMPGPWTPDWELSVWGRAADLSLRFPPSYVHGGSATALVRSPAGDLRFGPYPLDGYTAEWQELLDVLDGRPPRRGVSDFCADLSYALRIADLATESGLEGVV